MATEIRTGDMGVATWSSDVSGGLENTDLSGNSGKCVGSNF